MRCYIVIILIVFSHLGFAQSPFNKLYGTSVDDDLFSGISLIDSNLFLLSLSDYSVNTGPIALFIDGIGNEVKSLQDVNIEGWNSKYHSYLDLSYVTTGGYYVYSESAQDVLLQIISDTSTIIVKHYGGPATDYGRDLEILSDSGFLIVGTTKSFGAGDYDVYIIRTDKNGDSLWTRTYGNFGGNEASGVEKENDSVYVVSGTWYNSNNNSGDIFVMKINLQGDILLFKLQDINNLQNFGRCLCNASDGGYVVAGVLEHPFSTYIGFMPGIYKFDNNLNLQWSKYYGNPYDGEVLDIKECYDNGFIMVGYSEQPGKGEDVYVVRTDSVGDTLWTKTLGGIYNDRAYSVVQTPDSGFAIVGNTYSYGAGGSDAFFLKLKPTGETTVSIGLPVENDEVEFSVYPNPANNFLTIDLHNSLMHSTDFIVYNSLGQFVFIDKLEKGLNSKRIDIKSLSQGVYIIELRDEYGLFGIRKFIKQ
jgi:hypothetical protein